VTDLEAHSVATVVVPEGGGSSVIGEALDSNAEWLWLLAPGAVPEDGALEHLLTSGEQTSELGAPVLLASTVVTPQGGVDPRFLPVVEVFRADLMMDALDQRLLLLRAARPGSLLVHRRAFESRPLPLLRSRLDYLVWTATVLKHDVGLLVPSSVVVGPPAVGHRWERPEIGKRLRFLAGDSLEPRERPWFAFHVAAEALATGRRESRARSRRGWRRSGSR